MTSGIYIVTLRNSEPISVNANDPRIADKSIKVTKANCKFGKAQNLKTRELNYHRTFGERNVNFKPIAILENIDIAEKEVLQKLNKYRMRGRTGRKNEWLEGIEAKEVVDTVLHTLNELNISYKQVI